MCEDIAEMEDKLRDEDRAVIDESDENEVWDYILKTLGEIANRRRPKRISRMELREIDSDIEEKVYAVRNVRDVEGLDWLSRVDKSDNCSGKEDIGLILLQDRILILRDGILGVNVYLGDPKSIVDWIW